MKKKAFIILIVSFQALYTKAQQSELWQGEVGATVGAAHYFGDINPSSSINRPKPALGVFYLKEFNNYLGLRLSAHYAQLGYSDIYSNNDFQKRRNLSFNTDIWEFALQGDFNFFKFIPNDPAHCFTPFITIGAGVFNYDPYAYLDGRKVYLRPLGTEGQNIDYKDASGNVRKPYGSMAFCFPIGIGFKYYVNKKMDLSLQITHRLTTTDYIDDVSTTYVGLDKFPSGPNGNSTDAQILQDRSFETGAPIGVEGRQRGWSKQKDQYIIAEVGLSFAFGQYVCPDSNPD